ncbi:MAG: hypothetical protein FD153_634 [Rhodospirillaceae bacterium]|nr:MAG: hypothetical protein FD153_634 [Rhodospirillaceae bacterium]
MVLLDLDLPDSNGTDTLDSLLRLVPDVPPVIVPTGLDDESVALKVMLNASMCSEHLEKAVFCSMAF